MKSKRIILVQLGSPKDPTLKSVRGYILRFLDNPCVMDINPIFRKLLLHTVILPFHGKKSQKKYEKIWDGTSFPLNSITRNFAQKLKAMGLNIEVQFLLDQDRKIEIDIDSIVVPLFPQYSKSTTGLVEQEFGSVGIKSFYNWNSYIDSTVNIIEKELEKSEVDDLVLSFHGLPIKQIKKGDPYLKQSEETFKLLRNKINKLSSERVHMTFQSKMGRGEWLSPYTEEYVLDLIRKGRKRVAIHCPSFVADCLETIYEINSELYEKVKSLGGTLKYIPCLNDSDEWCEGFKRSLEEKIDMK